MKRLYIVRHAKSSWNSNVPTDFERPLNHRGLRDAPLMANLVKRLYAVPDRIISSPAMRAVTTAKLFAQEFGHEADSVDTRARMYESGLRDYLEVLAELEHDVQSVMLVGHNPTVSGLAEYLSNNEFDNIPTCGIAVIDLDIPKWKDAAEGAGTCIAYEYPKKYKLKEK